MGPRMRPVIIVAVAVLLGGIGVPAAMGHLCDNVFRQPDKLVVKPEITNIIVKESIAFKVYLQNNMDRGIQQIRLGGRSRAFDVKVSPEQMSLPKDARAFFNVELKTRPNTRSGSYPLDFRLYAVKGQAEQEYKRFRLGGDVGCLVPRVPEGTRTDGTAEGPDEPEHPIKLDAEMTEPAWRKALVMSSFRSTEGRPAEPQTIALAVFDSRALYVALTCLEPRDGPASARDGVSLQFMPHGRADLYSAVMGSDGSLHVSVRRDAQVRVLPLQSVKHAAGRGDGEWRAELALPWALFGMSGPPQPGETWQFNIVRRRVAEQTQTSFWAGSPADFEDPESYGRLFFAPEP